jgi:hypothetical protein
MLAMRVSSKANNHRAGRYSCHCVTSTRSRWETAILAGADLWLCVSDYTVIGDTVNLAARLEDLTKECPYKILVNAEVYREVNDKIPCVDLGFAHVRGKGGDVHIYGVVRPEDFSPRSIPLNPDRSEVLLPCRSHPHS